MKRNGVPQTFISPGNIKLGLIPSFSTPPVETCPGRTVACSGCSKLGYCYILKMIALRPSIGVSYAHNLEALLAGNFLVPVARWISKHNPSMFRFSVAGDIFSPRYAQDIHKLAVMFPGVRFLAFTRSWRVKRLRPDLKRLRSLPNFQLIASQDSETEPAPAHYRAAHAGKPSSPRPGRRTILCPGYGPKELTCDKCGICFRPGPDIYFPIH